MDTIATPTTDWQSLIVISPFVNSVNNSLHPREVCGLSLLVTRHLKLHFTVYSNKLIYCFELSVPVSIKSVSFDRFRRARYILHSFASGEKIAEIIGPGHGKRSFQTKQRSS
jgi:hypothetical protein